jgi:hypothetical protein
MKLEKFAVGKDDDGSYRVDMELLAKNDSSDCVELVEYDVEIINKDTGFCIQGNDDKYLENVEIAPGAIAEILPSLWAPGFSMESGQALKVSAHVIMKRVNRCELGPFDLDNLSETPKIEKKSFSINGADAPAIVVSSKKTDGKKVTFEIIIQIKSDTDISDYKADTTITLKDGSVHGNSQMNIHRMSTNIYQMKYYEYGISPKKLSGSVLSINMKAISNICESTYSGEAVVT